MNGSPQRMYVFMDGHDKRFNIPVYQRKYSWEKSQCAQLYNDLKKLACSSKESYFLGSVVYSGVSDAGKTECQIIDGQQRLTTITILLLAMHNLLVNNSIHSSDNALLADEILTTYIVDRYTNGPIDKKIKLHPVEEDRIALIKLFDSDENNYVKNSRITTNYRYFCDVLRKGDVSVEALYMAFKKLEIIAITLDAHDDAQLIFESLNSTGMDLSEGDKIRNYLLMNLPPRQQNEVYNNYWLKIENLTNADVSGFVRDYLSIKRQKTPNLKDIYPEFKDFAENQSKSKDELLADMLKYASHYNRLLTCDSGLNNSKLDACLYRMKRLDYTVTHPFFLAVFELASRNILSSDDVLKIFTITENFLFRRYICDGVTCSVPSNALKNIFLYLDSEIQRYDGTTDNYVAKFTYALRSKTGTGQYPNDAMFSEALGVKDIYGIKGAFRSYIFERFQGCMGVGEIDVYSLLDEGEYSIEHIMPQTLSHEWEVDLGSDYENIHSTWLHRLANLTLTVCNSNLRNHTFTEKLNDPDGGYIHSGLWMNQWIATKTSWGLTELRERDTLLRQTALEIWAYPETTYAPAVPTTDSCSLSDENLDLTGCGISRFMFLDRVYSANNWTSMFETVVKELHQYDESVLSNIASQTSGDTFLERYVSFNQNDLRNAYPVDDQIFIETNTNTPLKLSILRHLFTQYGFEQDDLIFYL